MLYKQQIEQNIPRGRSDNLSNRLIQLVDFRFHAAISFYFRDIERSGLVFKNRGGCSRMKAPR